MEAPVNSINISNIEHIGFCQAANERLVFTVWATFYSLSVPVYLLVLYIAFKKWKKRPSVNFSHSDVFTFNIVFAETFCYIGVVIVLVSMYTDLSFPATATGYGLMFLDGFGQMFFHSFTCVDRYLAVIHPVTYLGLKQQSRVTARNITVAFVWLLCVGHMIVSFYNFLYEVITGIVIPCLTLAVVMFCTISVLCVLIRPKPGEIDRVKKSSDKTKRQAFYTIAFIFATLMLRFMTETLFYIINVFGEPRADPCFLPAISLWFSLPSDLVLPLLFLHRAGGVKACKRLCKV